MSYENRKEELIKNHNFAKYTAILNMLRRRAELFISKGLNDLRHCEGEEFGKALASLDKFADDLHRFSISLVTAPQVGDVVCVDCADTPPDLIREQSIGWHSSVVVEVDGDTYRVRYDESVTYTFKSFRPIRFADGTDNVPGALLFAVTG